jgi:hypothetical protein
LANETVKDIATSFDIEAAKAKPVLVALLFFDYANQTSEGKVNLLGIFDRIFVDPNEKKTVPFGLFVRTNETLDSPVKIVIISPENKIVGNLEYELPRKSAPVTEKQKQVMMQVMLQVQFAAPLEGGYWFDVSFEGQSLGGAPLTVAYRDLKEIKETEGAK